LSYTGEVETCLFVLHYDPVFFQPLDHVFPVKAPGAPHFDSRDFLPLSPGIDGRWFKLEILSNLLDAQSFSLFHRIFPFATSCQRCLQAVGGELPRNCFRQATLPAQAKLTTMIGINKI